MNPLCHMSSPFVCLLLPRESVCIVYLPDKAAKTGSTQRSDTAFSANYMTIFSMEILETRESHEALHCR